MHSSDSIHFEQRCMIRYFVIPNASRFSWRVYIFCAAASWDAMHGETGSCLVCISSEIQKAETCSTVFQYLLASQNLHDCIRSTSLPCSVIHWRSISPGTTTVHRQCVVRRSAGVWLHVQTPLTDAVCIACPSSEGADPLPGFSGSLQKAQYKENTLYVLVNCTFSVSVMSRMGRRRRGRLLASMRITHTYICIQ